jgi:hypothetical protein
MTTDVAAHAQADEETHGLVEFFPEHPPRADTAEYRATHRLLVRTLDGCCADCGVRTSTLGDPARNPYGAKQLETHHYPIQRELADAVDPAKVARDFPEVTDRRTLKLFIDSPRNMLVLCDVCHRSPTRGIHHISASMQAVKKYLLDGYVLADTAAHQAADLSENARVTAGENPVDQL